MSRPIERVINEARQTGAAIVGIVPVDTVKLVHLNKIRQTLTRERLILTQTPQVFRYDLIREAFDKARETGSSVRMNRVSSSGWSEWKSA
jgi:2-C-methyl-D-erythritol 4-phosphate cytidylyltransferase